MVETAGLKRGEWGAETKVAPTLEITRQHMIWMVYKKQEEIFHKTLQADERDHLSAPCEL